MLKLSALAVSFGFVIYGGYPPSVRVMRSI